MLLSVCVSGPNLSSGSQSSYFWLRFLLGSLRSLLVLS